MRKKKRTKLDGRPLGQISFGVLDRISENSKGQVAGRKTPKDLPKNASMLPMRRSDGPERYGRRGPTHCLTPRSSKNRTLSPADCNRLQIADPTFGRDQANACPRATFAVSCNRRKSSADCSHCKWEVRVGKDDRVLERATCATKASDKKVRASLREAHIRSGFVRHQPAELDRARKGCAVLIGRTAILEEGTVD